MGIIVQKFGGTSVGDIERIQKAAERIQETVAKGHQVVVVVSAMGQETDRLSDLANQITTQPKERELAVLLASGEQVSMSLLSLALNHLGQPAQCYTGMQVGIRTTGRSTKARIIDIETAVIQEALDQGKVVIVAGFQGVNDKGEITTLGRGGSDTTAVALAVALQADECQIYTDVDGVYTADPQVVSQARLLETVHFEHMQELSQLGARVLQNTAVNLAGKYKLPIRVLSSLKTGQGTLVDFHQDPAESLPVTGVTFRRHEAKFTVFGLSNESGVVPEILEALTEQEIPVDLIIQNIDQEGTLSVSFTVSSEDFKATKVVLERLSGSLQFGSFVADDGFSKLSVVGSGVGQGSAIAEKMFATLAECHIRIHLISTSDIKVSVVIEKPDLGSGLCALHQCFGLDKKSS